MSSGRADASPAAGGIERAAEGPRTEAARKAIEQLRMNLLDITNRNKLVSMKHSEKARTHVRVIDELPDQLMEKLEDGKSLAFKALPEPEDEPEDEKSDEFQMALEEARESDPTYLEALEKLEGDDPNSRKAQQIERALKDRVREQLGWEKRAHTDVMSIAEYARAHGYEPSYDLPEPNGEQPPHHHTDNEIQTLLLPEQMERKLSGLTQQAKSALQEMGANTLYVAVGFLEWYEGQTSSKALVAPLLLHPVEITRRLAGTRYRYEIESTGEETEVNITLSERLARDFGLRLPDYVGEDTPETYFEKIREQIIQHHPRWNIRRFVTVGHFSFARLVMYRDLDPANWPEGREMHTHAGLSALLGGSNEEEGTSAEPYPVDDPEIARRVPLLISDADSSQFSAIVDVMDGKNLAIEGPPGTGKSQTITNIIGAGLAQGKRVLFIAEKMAALQVVKSRLDAAGIGDFAFELHSTKARKTDVMESLEARLQVQNQGQHPERLDDARRTLTELKEQLTRYVDLLNARFGSLGLTIQQILWAEQRTRDAGDLPAAIADVRLDGAVETTPYAKDEAKGHMRVIERHVNDFVQTYGGLDAHPWYGVNLPEIGPFDRDSILRAIAAWREAAEALGARLDEAPGLAATPADARRLLAARDRLPETCGLPALFARLADADALAATQDMVTRVNAWASARTALATRCTDPEGLADQADQIAILADEGVRLDLGEQLLDGLPDLVEQERGAAAHWCELVACAEQLLAAVRLEGPATAKRVRPLIATGHLAKSLDRRLLLQRTANLVDESSAEPLERGRRTRDDLLKRKQEIERFVRLPLRREDAAPEMRMHAGFLIKRGLFAGLSGDVRRAKRFYKQMDAGGKRGRREDMARRLEDAAALTEEIQAFARDSELKQICGARFEGIETDFESLIEINRFASRAHAELAGVAPERKAARKLLLHGEMDELDDLLALAGDGRFDQLARALDELGDDVQLADLAARLEDRAADIEALRSRADTLGLAGDTPVGELADLHAHALALAEARDAVRGNAAALDVLREAGCPDLVDPTADRADLEATVAAAQDVHALDLPEATRRHLLAEDYDERRAALLETADGVARDLTGYDKAAAGAVDAADLDVHGFLQADPEAVAMPDVLARIRRGEGNPDALQALATYVGAWRRAGEAGLRPVLEAYDTEGRRYENLELAYERALYRSLARAAYETHPELNSFDGVSQEDARARFKSTDRELIELERRALHSQLARAPITPGNAEGLVREKTELGLIRHVLSLQKPRTPIRDLINRAGRAIQEMKPCFMMSPLSVAQYLKPGRCEFDLVVIDEASQMKPEDSIGGLVRAGQIVVVGDPKQLPPTSFFDRVGDTPEEDEDASDADQIESILETAMNCWQPYRRLLWHYRSRHGSLIAFSNEKFYDRALIVFPAPVKDNPEYGVRMETVDGTCRRGGTNLKEAQRVAEAAVEFMRREVAKDEEEMRSLGVVAMNRAQTELIADEVSRMLSRVPDAYRYTEVLDNRGGGIEGFFVKNLENVQGDERDVIYISTTYGPDPDSGIVHQRFGPINSDLGYRRLNVLFTRAKEQVKLFTSMRAADVRINEENVKLGRRALHDYLEYAATGRLYGGDGNGRDPDSDFEWFVKARLEACGFNVDCQVGVAGYFIDLAVSHPGFPDGYLAGVECDGAMYHSAMSARDRDRLRQEVLENLGWDIYRVWSTDWFAAPDAEIRKLDRHLHDLLRRKAPTIGGNSDRD